MPPKSMVFDDTRKEFIDSENQNRMPGRERPSAGGDEEDLKGGLV